MESIEVWIQNYPIHGDWPARSCLAVGVNREIISDGVNGFLANSTQEWEERLRELITNHELRKQMGLAGRQTVEVRYSVNAHADRLANWLIDAAR